MIETKYSDEKRDAEFNRAVGDFVSTLVFGQPGGIKSFCSLAVLDGTQLIAGVLFYDHDPKAGVMQLSAASVDRRWLTRRVLREMFSIPFKTFGCQTIVLRVSERNNTMLRIARSYGFKEFVIPRLRGRDEAEHIMTLSDDDWQNTKFKGTN